MGDNRLVTVDFMLSLSSKRNLYRGKYLGSSLTQAQQETIASGEFEDLYVGDYWTINQMDYIIADFDYWYGVGDTPMQIHHVVVIPRRPFVLDSMNDTDTTAGGYIGSKYWREKMGIDINRFTNAFGSMHVLTHREYLINAVANDVGTAGAWYDCPVVLPSEIMVYGTTIRAHPTTSVFAVTTTSSRQQLALFRLNPQAAGAVSFWLRDVVSRYGFAVCAGQGHAGYSYATVQSGYRPVVAIG